MQKNKFKKLFISCIVFAQILSLTAGNFFVARAALVDNITDALTEDLTETITTSVLDSILRSLGIQGNSSREGGATVNVAEHKSGMSAANVSIMFSPSNPKIGEKATANAVAMGFSNDREKIYYTWFIKRKGCELKVKNKDTGNEYKTDSESYDPGRNYPTHEQLPTEPEEGAIFSQSECDSDLDGLITVNDWKVTAGKMMVQNGFVPDVGSGGKYDNTGSFYDEDSDSDGYQAWQGGGDNERMNAHCFGYHPTDGLKYELLKRPSEVPTCLSGDKNKAYPVHCGENVNYTTTQAGYNWGDSGVHYNPNHYYNIGAPGNPAGETVGFYTCDAMSDVLVVGTGPHAGLECRYEGYDPGMGTGKRNNNICCKDPNIEGGTDKNGNGSGWHMDLEPQTEFTACGDAPNINPRCVAVPGTSDFAAVCGEDGDKNAIDDGAYLPMCMKTTKWYDRGTAYDTDGWPTVATLREYLTEIGESASYLSRSSLSASDAFYYYVNHCKHSDLGGAKPLSTGLYPPASNGNDCDGPGERQFNDHLPSVRCRNFWPLGDTLPQEDYSFEEDGSVPFVGDDNNPVCKNRSATKEDLLCGYGPIAANSDNQFHLFPQRLTDENGKVNTNFYKLIRDYYSGKNFEYKKGNNTGNNSFGKKDEQFWGTDPRNSSTSGSGQPDEAVLTGMGLDKFTWRYEEGDEVGVAVEGLSTITTKFADSSRMIMWGFSKGLKQATNKDEDRKDEAACQPKTGGWSYSAPCADTECTKVNGEDQLASIPMAFLNFETCLENSTLPLSAGSSLTGSQPQGMEVTLSANPANPLNDETGEGGGDTINIQAMISGASGSESDLNYIWKIQAFKPTTEITRPTDRDWTNSATTICGKGESSTGCPLTTEKDTKLKTNGLGLKSINFKLNLKPADITYGKLFNKETGVGYFRISLEARESAEESSDPNSRVGRGDVVVKVSSTKNQISAFLAKASGTKLVYDEKICTEGQEKIVCPVVKNQIIALEVPKDTKTEELTDFTWFLDGKPINTCDKELSDKCENNKSTRTTFIPITDSGDEDFIVSVKASNIAGTGTGTGKKVELSRKFKRVEPSVKIVPDGGGVWKKFLGTWIDPKKRSIDKTKFTDDFSESILETASGNDVSLKIDYNPKNISSSVYLEKWEVDGEQDAAPQFKAGAVGTVHNVSASVVYLQPKEIYGILSRAFGVSVSEMKDQPLSSSVQIEVNEAIVTSGIQKTTRFMANLLEKIPQQFLFMLRLILSVGVMLVLVGGIFAFFPETAYDERRRE